MSDLQKKFSEAHIALAGLDKAVADAIHELKTAFEKKIAGIESAHVAQLTRLERELDEQNEELEELRKVAGEIVSEQKGVLPIERLDKKLLFEKLAACWDHLDNADTQDLEKILDRKGVTL